MLMRLPESHLTDEMDNTHWHSEIDDAGRRSPTIPDPRVGAFQIMQNHMHGIIIIIYRSVGAQHAAPLSRG